MAYQTLQVTLPNHVYPVYIGQDLLKNPALLAAHIHGRQVMVVTQKNIAKFYLKDLLSGLSDYQCDVTYLPRGEKHKTFASWSKILNSLLKKGHERSTTIIALGGGIVGDVAGFAAACYQRGVAYIQIPTTLIAQVDASVGGKTGINHAKGKNLIGAFYQPQCVIVDTLTLKSLPEREFTAGLAEVIKYGLIKDAEFFSWLEAHMLVLKTQQQEILQQAIARCIQIKATIVAQDECEQNGIRSLLNFGHTTGHVLETLFNYRFLHGEAVAIGMNIAAQLSMAVNGLSQASYQRVKTLLMLSQLPLQVNNKINVAKFLSYLNRDKKRRNNQLQFVLLKDIGVAELTSEVSTENLIEIISRF